MIELERDPVFQYLPVEALDQIAKCLSFNPHTGNGRDGALRSMSHDEQLRWLDANRNKIEDEVCSIGSWSGERLPYGQVVRKLAKKIRVDHNSRANIAHIEKAIIAKVWSNAVENLNPEERQKLQTKVHEVAAQHGRNYAPELAGVTALTAAQLSGFGVYLLGSTLLGAMNGALGLGLSFSAFTGLSSAIATAIGPIGWGFLGLSLVFKLMSPNYKKVLPVVIIVALHRPRPSKIPLWKSPPFVLLVVLPLLIWVIWLLAHK